MGGLNGETLCFHPISLLCSTYQVGSVRLRDDVGIVPYIHVGLPASTGDANLPRLSLMIFCPL